MAVINLPSPSRLQLRLLVGIEEGREIFRLRTFGNVKPDTTDEDFMEVAQALGGLQIHEVNAVRRVDQSDLVEEE